MFTRLSSFTVDYTKESHLIIPFQEADETMEFYTSPKGIIYILAYHHLFVIADSHDSEISTFIKSHKKKIRHALFPSGERTDRWLMKREKSPSSAGRYSLLSEHDIKRIADFYTESTPFDTDEVYLSSLYPDQSEFALMKDEEGKIISALYTIKNNQCAAAVATDPDYQGKGYASRLINSLSFSYLFCEDESLIPFYEKLGFSIVREYQEERYS